MRIPTIFRLEKSQRFVNEINFFLKMEKMENN